MDSLSRDEANWNAESYEWDPHRLQVQKHDEERHKTPPTSKLLLRIVHCIKLLPYY